MTLVVVHNNRIYCDSYCTNGESNDSAEKVRSLEWNESTQIEAYTVAGSPDAATSVMEYLATVPASEWPSVDLTRFGECANFTVIVFRRTGFSRPGIIDLSPKHPSVRPALAPESSGLQFLAGSGWNYFAAYFHEHKDLEKALELTALHHRDVVGPFRQF